MNRLVLLTLLAGCNPPGEGSSISIAVSAIEVRPPSTTIETGPDGAGTVQYEAIATFEDGVVAPLEDLVAWSLSDQSAGEIDSSGLFTASTENGAVCVVTATHNRISATAELKVIYSDTIEEGGVTDASAFDGSPVGQVYWLYPEDGVALPRNVPSLTFMWEAVDGAEGYRLSFETDITAVKMLTDQTSFTVDGDLWEAIAATNAGGEVEVQVRAIAGGQLYASEVHDITVRRFDAQGSIYYWSTTEEGIVKVPIEAEEGEMYYGPGFGADECVACHVVRGDRMGVAYDGGIDEITGFQYFIMGIADITSDTPTELTSLDTKGYFSTLSPDGSRLITTTQDGGLNYWDATTGTLLRRLDTGDTLLSQPDWSPDGSFIAAVRVSSMSCDTCWGDGEIVTIPIDEEGNLGEITSVVDMDGSDIPAEQINAFYPAISPDGKWIAFNAASKDDALDPNSSYNNPKAALYVVSVDGGDPIELQHANYAARMANSWPHWGPLPDDDVYWLVFSSVRPYGDRVTDGRNQIWVTAFEPEFAEAGQDPSRPAFWLPNQNPETSNHTTFWGP